MDYLDSRFVDCCEISNASVLSSRLSFSVVTGITCRSMLDKPMTLQVNLPVVDTIHP